MMKHTWLFALYLLIYSIGITVIAQDEFTGEVISAENVSRLIPMATVNLSADTPISRLQWLPNSPDSFLIYGRFATGMWLFDVHNIEAEPRFFVDRGLLSPDGRYWAMRDVTQDEVVVRLFDTTNGELRYTLRTDMPPGINDYFTLAFNPTSTSVATASENTISIWDIDTGTLSTTITSDREISSLLFNFDGSLIAAGLADVRVGIWNSVTSEVISEVGNNFNPVRPRFVSTENWLLIQYLRQNEKIKL